MTKQVYILGDMLTKSSQLLRAKEREDIQNIGLDFYNPMENKEINDKANLDNNEGLAEKIVRQDTDAIISSDVIVAEPLPHALGSHVEIGQIKGMKDMAKMILDIADGSEQPIVILDEILKLAERIENQKFFPHYEDIRRFKGVTESEDRRSLGINQYVYGVVLELTNNHGFYEWEEILEELKRIKKDPSALI